VDTTRLPRHATKIVATLGPASNTLELIEQMIVHKVSVVRLNFSHGTAQDHIDRATMVREAARRAGREVAIMADLAEDPRGQVRAGQDLARAGRQVRARRITHRTRRR
jgi:pyruvate kinase